MTAYPGSRTHSSGTDFTYLPRPHSWSVEYETLAYHSPDGHLTQASWTPGTQRPSCHTSTARGGSMRRMRSLSTRTTVRSVR